ncbi:MAG: TAXI family TRAP transporter solute-binding subunit [Alphaproteobacteria bacterium]|nr:TAXI family TRAP transporter solute-binding subunit [Alphaproteobacteria bacterium]
MDDRNGAADAEGTRGALWRPGGTRARAIAVLLLALAGSAAVLADEPQFFRIGTAGTTGTYFQIGGLIASAISNPPGSPNCQRGGTCGVPGLIAVAQATQGSVENVELIGKNQLEAAIAQADVVSWAYHGTGIFKNRAAIPNLRAIGGLFPESLHLVVQRDGPIQTLKDLKGKRVALGEKESGTLVDARIVLEAAGLNEHDIKADFSRLGEAAAGLRDNNLDALFLLGGYPTPAISDLAGSTPIRLVPIGEDIFEKLKKRYPFFSRTTVPAGTYQGLGSDTPTLGIRSLLITGNEVPEALVYAVTKSLWNEATRTLLASRNAPGDRIQLGQALDGLDIPLHPGAERFYREIGRLSDATKQ